MKASQAKNHHFQEQFQDSQANFSEAMNNGDTGDGRANKGQPIQLIKIKPSGKIEINPDALEIIASCDLPVGFVSLVGKSRTGKSFLLNKLLNIDGPGFRVDPSTKACTEGIWMWSEAFFNEQSGNFIFFLDTQGTDSLIRGADNDTKIFTLATLISSYFMFNSTGVIDERSLSQIQMITALSKQIKADQKLSERDNQQALYQYMPKFLWILRDFTLKLQDDKGRKITANQYLQNCLTDQSSISRVNQQSRKIKKSIMSYFKSRECMVLVRPVGEEYDLHRLNSIPTHALRRQFLDGVNTLRSKILANATAKLYEGQPLTGYAITSMIQSYVDAFNSGKTPSIKNAWQQIAQDEGAMAYNKALDKYNELFGKAFQDDQPKGNQIHKVLADIREQTIRQYQANTDQRNDQYEKKLKQFLDSKNQQTININDDLNELRDTEILKKHAQKLRNKLERGEYANNKPQLTKDIDEVMDNYKRDAKGARKGQIIAQFYKTLTPIISSIDQNAPNQANDAQMKIQMQQMERKLKIKEQQAESMRKRLQSNDNVSNMKNGKVGAKLPDDPRNKDKGDKGEKKKTGCCGGECSVM